MEWIVKRKGIELLLIVICYVLQVTLFKALNIGGISPNFMVMFPIFAGFYAGSREGIFTGFVAGVMQDVFFSSLFGFSSLVFVIYGYLTGRLSEDFDDYEWRIPMLILLASDFVYESFVYFGNFVLHGEFDFLFAVRRIMIPEMMYTGIVGLILIWPFRELIRKTRPAETKRERTVTDDETVD